MTFSRIVLALSLSVAVLWGGVPAALARDCPLKGEEGGCKVPLGEYFVRMPKDYDRLQRLPVVMLLHDAGQETRELIGDDRLVGRFLERGYAVVMPLPTHRKYVRVSVRRNPGLVLKANKSKMRYLLEDSSGELRELVRGKDRGWYFRSSDIKLENKEAFKTAERTRTPIGRDEEKFLESILVDAERQYWLDPNKLAVVGIGHGASLAWQLACRKPEMAVIFAPVNGTYWMDPPDTCVSGVRMIHTHEKDSTFWPLEGRERLTRRFRQAAVDDVLNVLANANGCGAERRQGASPASGKESWEWPGCGQGASVALNLIDGKFDYPDWWLDQVLGGPKRTFLTGATPAAQGETPLAKPRFMKPRFIVKP